MLYGVEGRFTDDAAGAEHAPLDGAWLCYPEKAEDLPRPGGSSRELLLWAYKNAGQCDFLHFDVKYISLRPSGLKDLDYAQTEMCEQNFREDSGIYVLVFDGLDDYVALVPKEVLENATAFGYGVEPLVLGVPAWCMLFLVCMGHLAIAIHRLVRAKETEYYQNPTTKVRFSGWVPKVLRVPNLKPLSETHRQSFEGMMSLMGAIEACGWECDFNHIAPMSGDFWAWCPSEGLDTPLFIEYKLRSGNHFAGEADSDPFRKDRQWHFLIGWFEGSKQIICCSRDSVKPEWEGRFRLKKADFESLCHKGIREVLDYMRNRAPSAIAKAENTVGELFDIVTAEPERCEAALEGMIAANAEVRGPQQQTRIPRERLHHEKGLPGVCERINGIFATHGYFICIPQDPTDPSGDHVIVDYQWTTEDKSRFERHGVLPLAPFTDEGLEGARSIGIRFADFSGGYGNAEGHPIVMRPAYWRKPCQGAKHIFFLGRLLKSSMLRNPTTKDTWDPCIFMPTEFTTLNESTRDPISDGPRGDHDAEFFDFREQHRDLVPKPEFTRSTPQAFVQGSEFLIDPAVNPLRYVIDLVSIFWIIWELFKGQSPTTSIQSPLTRRPNRSFEKAGYFTSVELVRQTTWDFGCEWPVRDASYWQG